MRNLATILACSLLLLSCKDKKKQPSQEPTKPEMHQELYGSYVGTFSDYEYDGETNTTMSLNIQMITEDGVQGYSIVNGNKRLLTGTIAVNGSSYTLDLKEPSDKKSDGIFHFAVQGDSINGTWKPLIAESKLRTKDIHLAKRKFKYDPAVMLVESDGYMDMTSHKDSIIHPDADDPAFADTLPFYRGASEAIFHLNASLSNIPEADLKNLKKLDLEILKNTIYARHGYAFKTKVARQFFDFQDWYMPIYDDVDGQLTKTEQTNIGTINRFIKYAQDNYDTFGR